MPIFLLLHWPPSLKPDDFVTFRYTYINTETSLTMLKVSSMMISINYIFTTGKGINQLFVEVPDGLHVGNGEHF